MNSATARTVARIAEGAYALVAFGLWLSLPFPPRAAFAATWVHWLGTAGLAMVLAFRLGRPKRVTLMIAAILAAYVLGTGVFALVRAGGALMRDADGEQQLMGLGLIATVWGSQIAVALALIFLWRGEEAITDRAR